MLISVATLVVGLSGAGLRPPTSSRSGFAPRMADENIASLLPLPATLAASLVDRGFETATPIQSAVLPRALSGESLIIHSETGSGKTLAMLLPALCKPGVVLMLSPTRELCVQLQDEARALLEAMEETATVAMVAQGYNPKPDALMNARVVIATPAEFCELVARGGDAPPAATAAGGEGGDGSKRAGIFAETLGSTVSTLILDEVDALVPGKKEFRGKRHGKWMDAGMHPAEAVVKLLAKRTSRDDFQLIAGSATLDQSTRRKISKLLRGCKVLQAKGAPRSLPLVTTAASTKSLEEDEQGGDADIEADPKRWTAVPQGIQHRRLALPKFDGLGGTEPACQAVVDVLRKRAVVDGVDVAADEVGEEGSTSAGGVLVFVSSRSTYLGGAHAVAKELRKRGLSNARALSDALWPDSTRARKRKPREAQKAKASGDGKDVPDAGARRASLNARFGEAHLSTDRQILVADAAATRGLHLDGVSTVIILGLPANPQTYLHLAGRTGRGWPPAVEKPGEALVVTVAINKEVQKLLTWGAMLGIQIEELPA